MATKIKAVIYARYSSHNQREESIEGQLRECRTYASRNDIIIVGEYIDRAISGKTDNRAEFQRMIRDSEKGHFNAVLMYTLDRFARNRYDSAMYKAKLKRNGVKVIYAKQYIPDEPEGIILESVLEGYAEFYSENLSRNIKRGMTENALARKSTGGNIPLGYTIGSDRTYVIDPINAAIVREIYQMYADGHSAKAVIEYCNSKGYKTSRHAPFNKNSLRSILNNDRYIGVYRYGDIVDPNGIPAIISKDLYERVQSRYKYNYKARAKGKAKEDYLLTGKLFCGYCGKLMAGESGKGDNGTIYRYYKCSTRKNHANCPKRTERKEWIEEVVTRFTVQTVLTDENIERIAEKTIQLITKEASDTSHLHSLQSELKEVTKRLSNLIDLMEQGISTDSTKDRLLELESQKKLLTEQIAHEKMKKPTLTKEHIIFWLESFRNGDIHDEEYCRRVIDTLVNSIFIFDTDGGKGRRLVFTFNISEQNTATLSLSDIASFAPPNCANSNWFIIKHTFGFVVEVEDAV